MSEQTRTKEERARQRRRFEQWMRKNWGGISLDVKYVLRDMFEYKDHGAQIGWEIWQKFNGAKP